MLKQKLVCTKGISFPLVILIFLTASLLTYGLIARQSTKLITSTKRIGFDKATHLADAGIEIAIGELRANPEYTRMPEDNITGPVPFQLNGKGMIYYTVEVSTMVTFGIGEAVVVSSGIYSVSGDFYGPGAVTKVVRAVLSLETPGDYFCASITDFIVGASVDISSGNGIIYGNSIEFKNNGAGPKSQIYEAQFASQCIPDDPTIFVDFVNGYKQVRHKVLPGISQELMKFYYDIALDDAGGNPAFLPDYLGGTYNLELPDNDNNIWYHPNVDPTVTNSTSSMTIDSLVFNFYDDINAKNRSCIVVVNGDLTINGSINPAGSSTYAIAFIVKGNVFVNTAASIDIERTLFVATNGKFKAKGLDVGNNFDFSGAAMFGYSFDIARGFKTGTRTYAYDPLVKDISNLPFIVSVKEYQTVSK